MLGLAVTAGPAHAQPAAPTPADAPPPAAPSATDTPPPVTPTLAENDPVVEQIKRELAARAKQFEFHGYFRAGFGVNSKGGDQDAFQAPGAYSKFRLGNETDSYGEFQFDSNWVNPERTDAWFKTSMMISLGAPRNSQFDLAQLALRQAYAEAGKVISSHPEMTIWAGQRYYRRRDIHITDFFFNDTSGYGAGFQDLKLGSSAKLNVAYFGGSIDETADLGRFAKNMLDIRVSDIAVGSGNLELWVFPTVGSTGDAADENANRSGVAAGVFHSMPFMGGSQELSVQFGYGGAANLSTFLEDIASDGWLLRVVDRTTVQPSPKLAIQWSATVQLDNKNGEAGGSGGNLWVSAGLRPVFAFTKYIGLAVEGGVDFVKPEVEGSDNGFLGKVTLAPVIRPGTDFWARPELRAFVTAAFWNDAIQGSVGGPAYAEDTFGLSAGVQMESWW